MRLSADDARARLDTQVHGVLCTLHPDRGPDPQPVVFAVSADGHIGVPIDRVKAKSSTRLRREDNLEADPRASLLVEHWETQDWSRLWWVRVDAVAEVVPAGRADAASGLALLAGRYPQYGGVPPAGPLIICRTLAWTGWAAAPPDGPGDGVRPGGWAGRVGRVTG